MLYLYSTLTDLCHVSVLFMTFENKRSFVVKSLFATALLTLLTLLASCASEATKLEVQPQGIEVQADADKTDETKAHDGKGHYKNGHDKEGHDKKGYGKRSNPFETVATTIGIDMTTLKTELGAGKSIATIAQENGVAAQTVIDALVAKSQTRIDKSVAAGKVSAEDAAAWQAKISERATNFVNNTGEALKNAKDGRGNRATGKGKGGKGKEKFTEIAQLIGIDAKTLFTELKAGNSIAQVASANGVNPQTLIDSLMQDIQTKLDEAVAAGKMTADEAQQKRVAMEEGIAAWINGTAKSKGKN